MGNAHTESDSSDTGLRSIWAKCDTDVDVLQWVNEVYGSGGHTYGSQSKSVGRYPSGVM